MSRKLMMSVRLMLITLRYSCLSCRLNALQVQFSDSTMMARWKFNFSDSHFLGDVNCFSHEHMLEVSRLAREIMMSVSSFSFSLSLFCRLPVKTENALTVMLNKAWCFPRNFDVNKSLFLWHFVYFLRCLSFAFYCKEKELRRSGKKSLKFM